ncbi:hypothetical protein O0I10_007242 [Lichtheimia ornata]|uniref:intramembrane prenyl-peptidase Rce1 n=1 Tax=Lichtheimia ornata TaxID=688661 RepID=A0AAD7V119_9FUNG|nr:uncharacterized protein O0I10_007242 [Lichtheimia ornata]KAJ8657162.1 hypothetical protein O0I10_007242 [Lichtheimia ornata]
MEGQRVLKTTANGCCIVLAFLYVVGFYLFRQSQDKKLTRDHPIVIRKRIQSVIVASLASLVVVWAVVPSQYHLIQLLGIALPRGSVLEMIGLFGPVALTAVLFLGPLTQLYYEQQLPFQSNFSFQYDVKDVVCSWVGQRNYIVAPATEEWVFRACMIALLYEAGHSISYLIFVSPMYFGLAHLHHAYENYHRLGATSEALKIAIFSSTFQFCYTTIFGWYASFVFLRMASIWPPILCHSFCNVMGFPDVSEISEKRPLERKVIWCCYVAGIILFIGLLYPLTEPSHVGGSFYWK